MAFRHRNWDNYQPGWIYETRKHSKSPRNPWGGEYDKRLKILWLRKIVFRLLSKGSF